MDYAQNSYNSGFTYNADIVFCIDATGSMGSSSGTANQGRLLDMVKENAIHFHRDLQEAMHADGKSLTNLRVRIIAFRDYIADGEEAMLVTDFFDLPRDEAAFEETILSIEPKGGGDIPEDGLEALAYAIKSDWTHTGTKRRHVIVLWTDAPCHDLGYGASSGDYPTGMPADLRELTAWWGNSAIGEDGFIEQSSKRLVLFAPEDYAWSSIMDNWNQVAAYPARAGEGLQELDYKQILDMIVNSITAGGSMYSPN